VFVSALSIAGLKRSFHLKISFQLFFFYLAFPIATLNIISKSLKNQVFLLNKLLTGTMYFPPFFMPFDLILEEIFLYFSCKECFDKCG